MFDCIDTGVSPTVNNLRCFYELIQSHGSVESKNPEVCLSVYRSHDCETSKNWELCLHI